MEEDETKILNLLKKINADVESIEKILDMNDYDWMHENISSIAHDVVHLIKQFES